MNEPVAPRDVLFDLVARFARVDRSRVRPEARLIDFGLDSVRTMDLVVELERALDVAIADEALLDLDTLGDLAAYLERKLARP